MPRGAGAVGGGGEPGDPFLPTVMRASPVSVGTTRPPIGTAKGRGQRPPPPPTAPAPRASCVRSAAGRLGRRLGRGGLRFLVPALELAGHGARVDAEELGRESLVVLG